MEIGVILSLLHYLWVKDYGAISMDPITGLTLCYKICVITHNLEHRDRAPLRFQEVNKLLIAKVNNLLRKLDDGRLFGLKAQLHHDNFVQKIL